MEHQTCDKQIAGMRLAHCADRCGPGKSLMHACLCHQAV